MPARARRRLSHSDGSALLRGGGGGGSTEGKDGKEPASSMIDNETSASSSSSRYPSVKVRQLGISSTGDQRQPPPQSLSSIVQGLLGVLDKTKNTDRDSECSSAEPCGICEGDCRNDRHVSVAFVCRGRRIVPCRPACRYASCVRGIPFDCSSRTALGP